ncbi:MULTISPECIES: spore coat protein [unclassified Bacillus (in: firmicutes)]|uniref:spore coat protein n=1 Tax=unclassified Bacillus (in: firmicutes) TaxID=185979 RepID=UPI0008E811A6|nr:MULTISPECIES: spore coat protein [unclassified Bacillus (in: firmicutes)]SFB14499.1 similar to spore coat protein [Bacillus sp. UNCCL13]SFQ89718.1 similar to spore coat protein [Bacillus sp. cl95]
MTNLLQNMAGMGGLTERTIASDFLISSKSAIRNLAFAITETATPELKFVLREQLRNAVDTHAKITDFMTANGYYHPNHLGDQINVRLQDVHTALNLKDQ